MRGCSPLRLLLDALLARLLCSPLASLRADALCRLRFSHQDPR
jgi:hypothetical protein